MASPISCRTDNGLSAHLWRMRCGVNMRDDWWRGKEYQQISTTWKWRECVRPVYSPATHLSPSQLSKRSQLFTQGIWWAEKNVYSQWSRSPGVWFGYVISYTVYCTVPSLWWGTATTYRPSFTTESPHSFNDHIIPSSQPTHQLRLTWAVMAEWISESMLPESLLPESMLPEL
jgi:hypothetical protein